MELSGELLIEISYVQISKYRTKTMKAMSGNVKIPSVIARDFGIMTNHISKVLSELKRMNWLNVSILKSKKADCIG
ncbi:hypothetical protein [uncultured Methanobrevibacter sp.]|uniref:hypothetical protein n=1 Tax=uncultured Methanobrevibacter sp. TaxID=253161 RepID=UPI00258C0456|nr:hypothetical protein [uncultured Methanobrevibacter sp.]